MSDEKANKINLRYNILTIVIYFIGAILLIQLFNLQIIKGEDYRKQSNTRLTRETILESARGEILDRTGNKLVTTTMNFSLEFYKAKISTETLNETLLKIAELLEENNDKYIDNFPVNINPYEFSINEEEQKEWKKRNNIKENFTAQECFEYYKNKYELNNYDNESARTIIAMRYQISKNGYSTTSGVELSKKISRESMLQLTERNSEFPGIDIVTKSSVYYTSGSLASHVLGTVGAITEDELEERKDTYTYNDIIGKTGIQYVYEEYLKGQNGKRQIDMSVDGTATNEYISKEAIAGANVVLTIDANLQKVTEDSLKKNIEKIKNGDYGEKSDADSGAVVVMNVNTGEVLALASYPDYEPQLFADGISAKKYNEYITSEQKPLFNRAISGTYAPGSTFKMVTAIAGLETNKITPSETINDTGVYPRAHNPVCWIWTSSRTGHGSLNVSDAIKHSCNYFFYETGYRITIDTLSKYARDFGLGKLTGIELPSEVKGELASREKAENNDRVWYEADTLSAAIGQSYNNFTPIQMAKYISTLVNGGKQVDVSIVKAIIDQNGNEIQRNEINKFTNTKLKIEEDTAQDLNIKKENLSAVLDGMKGVTSESGGTAYSTFKDFNIEIGGKTGSAQAESKTNGWFVGFGPYDSPEIAVVVLVENAGHGGYTAEVARDIFAEYFGMNADKVTEDMSASKTVQTIR